MHSKEQREKVFFKNFIYFERERERERERENKQGRGAERGGERIPSRLCTISVELDMGLKLMALGS